MVSTVPFVIWNIVCWGEIVYVAIWLIRRHRQQLAGELAMRNGMHTADETVIRAWAKCDGRSYHEVQGTFEPREPERSVTVHPSQHVSDCRRGMAAELRFGLDPDCPRCQALQELIINEH